jgi:hypothetical protein
MANDPTDLQRRALMQMAAGLAAASQLGPSTAMAAAIKPAPTGKPGDFDFLSGNWKIKNRQLKDKKWDQFDSEATVVGMLAGIASVEELRIPSKKFSGMGLRLLDVEKKWWADYWISGKNGLLTPPPAWGSFVNGVGTWDSDEEDDNKKPIIVRGVWDKITSNSCRWYQASSSDNGKTWEENWIMEWARAKTR